MRKTLKIKPLSKAAWQKATSLVAQLKSEVRQSLTCADTQIKLAVLFLIGATIVFPAFFGYQI